MAQTLTKETLGFEGMIMLEVQGHSGGLVFQWKT